MFQFEVGHFYTFFYHKKMRCVRVVENQGKKILAWDFNACDPSGAWRTFELKKIQTLPREIEPMTGQVTYTPQ